MLYILYVYLHIDTHAYMYLYMHLYIHLYIRLPMPIYTYIHIVHVLVDACAQTRKEMEDAKKEVFFQPWQPLQNAGCLPAATANIKVVIRRRVAATQKNKPSQHLSL